MGSLCRDGSENENEGDAANGGSDTVIIYGEDSFP
jgi:hypothetical protein